MFLRSNIFLNGQLGLSISQKKLTRFMWVHVDGQKNMDTYDINILVCSKSYETKFVNP